MAKMIPPHCDETTVSAAEKRVFHLLKNDPAILDWVVLHSLGLSRRGKHPYGEIDFVALTPCGSVICLEVKGGRVTCNDGVWATVDRFGVSSELTKSPFLQARDGMFAVMRAVQGKYGAHSDPGRALFAYAVIFPDIDPPPHTPEFEPWEAISRWDLEAPISNALRKLICAQRKKIGISQQAHNPAGAVAAIRQFLRPDFERLVSRSTTISQSEIGLIGLTDDQYAVLDMINDNPRCLIEGAAGTGKTVLAVEYARREALSGKRVVLVCFNRLLGDWFEQRAKEFAAPTLTATSFFRYVRDLVMSSEFRDEYEREARKAHGDRAAIFSELLPLYGQLAAEARPASIDVLVMDEAQDLLTAERLSLLHTLLLGGITGGHWYMFGDFTRQCIHSSAALDSGMGVLEAICAHFARTKLRTNCRNTRRIGEETALLSGFSSPPYKLGQVDGLPVDYRYWKKGPEQLEQLTAVIEGLLNEGIDPKDVVLISRHRISDSIAARLSIRRGKRSISVHELRDGAETRRSSSSVGFATVYAFKGMESRIVIFCDVEQVEADEPQALLYTGMSRARSLLVMLVRDSERAAIASSLARKLSEGWKHDHC
jgi:hypothetical protein